MMFNAAPNLRSQLLPAALCLLCLALPAHAQQTQRATTTEQTGEVVRITTELVQTDVMVFDKQGRFVDSLRPEEFELQVGGKTQTLSFFERVTAGSSREAAQLAAIGSNSKGNATTPRQAAETEASTRGRIIFFFLDDLHLSGASLIRAREALQRFVDEQMNPNDQVAIVSTSGQIGFLQQLTDNQTVLRAAIKRLNYKQNPEAYTGKTRITDYMASQILDNGNLQLFAYLMESIKLEQQMGPGNRQGDHRVAASYSAIPYLENRINQVYAQSRMTTADTLDALRSLMLSSSALPGRKLVFFLSDGFLVNERQAGALAMLHSVTQTAARAGAVVYTMDMRGTITGLGSEVDASTNDYIDFSSRRAGIAVGEIAATREALQIIADDTGGRASFNSGAIDDQFRQAIDETSNYYLLAWRPDSAEQRDQRARLKVIVRGHPELRVRLRTNYFSPPVAETRQPDKARQSGKPTADNATAKETSGGTKAVTTTQAQANDAELLATLGSLYPHRQLPASLSVGYLNTSDQGTVLRVSMQLDRALFDFDGAAAGGERKALVDVMGAAIDDRGQFASFKQLLTVTPDASGDGASRAVIWHQQLRLKPGLYQVRVALRERATGRTGSAMQWIEIPDPSKNAFSLSSLYLGERPAQEAAPAAQEAAAPRAIIVDVDHRFARSSVLRFQTYIYNAARGTAAADHPDVRVQAQVFRERRQMINIAPVQVPLTGDLSRLPFWSEIALAELPPGRYTLQVTATDRISNRTATERVNFSIE